MKFNITGEKGHAVMDYDVETGEVKFNELLSAGLMPFTPDSDTKQLVKVDAFDKSLEEISWLPKLVGG